MVRRCPSDTPRDPQERELESQLRALADMLEIPSRVQEARQALQKLGMPIVDTATALQMSTLIATQLRALTEPKSHSTNESAAAGRYEELQAIVGRGQSDGPWKPSEADLRLLSTVPGAGNLKKLDLSVLVYLLQCDDFVSTSDIALDMHKSRKRVDESLTALLLLIEPINGRAFELHLRGDNEWRVTRTT